MLGESNPSSFQRNNTYEEAVKVEMQKCRMMEREVATLRDEIENTKKNEEWCNTAGERTFQELTRLRAEVPAIEMERDRANGEKIHLSHTVEQLGMHLQKEIIERDHWKQNIMDLQEDLEMLELKKMEDLAAIEQTRFMQLQSKNMAEQYVINNNTIELENRTSVPENDRRIAEINAAKQNIMYFESERNSLLQHVTLKKAALEEMKQTLDTSSKENDELHHQLDIERNINPRYYDNTLKLPNPLRHVPGALRGIGKAISERRISSGNTVCVDGTSLGFGNRRRLRRQSFQLGSSFSVRSAPTFKFSKGFEKSGRVLEDSLESISESENSL